MNTRYSYSEMKIKASFSFAHFTRLFVPLDKVLALPYNKIVCFVIGGFILCCTIRYSEIKIKGVLFCISLVYP